MGVLYILLGGGQSSCSRSERLRDVISDGELSKDTEVDFLWWWFGHDVEYLLCFFLSGTCDTFGCRSDIRKLDQSVERESQWKVFQNSFEFLKRIDVRQYVSYLA